MNHMPRCATILCPRSLFYLKLYISFGVHIIFLIRTYYHPNNILSQDLHDHKIISSYRTFWWKKYHAILIWTWISSFTTDTYITYNNKFIKNISYFEVTHSNILMIFCRPLLMRYLQLNVPCLHWSIYFSIKYPWFSSWTGEFSWHMKHNEVNRLTFV